MADDRTDDAGNEGDDSHNASLDQLQRAALEAIKAARGVLDAAEKLVADPKAAEAVVRTVADAARHAGEAVTGLAARARPPATDDDRSDDPDDDPPGGVQHIPVG